MGTEAAAVVAVVVVVTVTVVEDDNDRISEEDPTGVEEYEVVEEGVASCGHAKHSVIARSTQCWLHP